MDATTLVAARKYAAKNYGNRFARALGARLASGIEPAAILVQGDSTGDGITEWPYLMAQWLGAKYPVYSVIYRLWDDALQCYGPPAIIQSGATGLAYARFPGTAGGYLSTPDKASLDITGDMEIVAKIASDDYTKGLEQTITGKFGVDGQMGFCFDINCSGVPYLWISSDGTENHVVKAENTLPVTDGEIIWVKCTLDVDNGAGGHDVKFYTSPDGVTWTQLAGTRTTAGVASIFANTQAVTIGTRGTGSSPFKGKIYKVIIKNGINGTPVVDFDASMAFPNGATSLDLLGNVWTVNGTASIVGAPGLMILNASVAGKAIAYSTDATRFALQASYEPQLAFINYGHNEGATVDYQSTYEGLCTQLLTKWPNAGVVCTAQNPQSSPEVNIVPHARRCIQIAALAAKNNYGLIDVFRAFNNYSDYTALMTDGCHPNAAGQALWVQEVEKFLLPAA